MFKRIITFIMILAGVSLVKALNIKGPALTIIIVALASIFIYGEYTNIVQTLFKNAAFWCQKKCNPAESQQRLDKCRKVDIVKYFKKRCFILDCYLILDRFNTEEIESFIDKNKSNRILMKKDCSISFEFLMLNYFFYSGKYDQFTKAFNHLNEVISNSRYSLNETVKLYLDAENSIVERKYPEARKTIESISKKEISEREKAYLYILESISFDKENNKKMTISNHEKALELASNLPLIANYYN